MLDFSAVIFDMDGLVLDSEATYFIAWHQAAATMGYRLSDAFCESLSGLSGSDVRARLSAECGADFDLFTFKQTADKAWREYVSEHGIAVKRGFNELLAYVVEQQLPYCLATNSRTANALECLELAGLTSVFSTIISRDDVMLGKPAPDIFFKSAETLQIPINQCLVLEDSHAGIVAATQAGAIALYVPSTSTIEPRTVELCTAMMPDLLAVLESIRV